MDEKLYNNIYGKIGNDNKYKDLLYARGYLISEKKHIVNEAWAEVHIANNIYITYDSENQGEYVSTGKLWVFILGTIMDTIEYHMDIRRIAHKIIEMYNESEMALYDYIDYLAGRYIILYGNDTDAFVLQDATGMRSAYYDTREMLIASHYNIINEISASDRHPFVAEWCSMKPLPWLLPGNITPYKDIMTLLPNHRLDMKKMQVKRFFPRKEHTNIDVNVAMNYIAECCHKQMNTLARYRKLMISFTKGNDSRITLAASKDIKNDILYYTYYGEKDPAQVEDVEFTRMFSKSHDLNYIEVYTKFKGTASEYEQLCQVCYHNHYHFHLFWGVPSLLEKLPRDRMAVRSNLIEIIRADYYSDLSQGADYKVLAKRLYPSKVDDINYLELIKKFYYENEYDKLFDYQLGDFIYWEYRMGIWMNGGVLLKDDISFDTYMLFNQRKMLEYGLSIPRYFKKKNTVVYETIKRLWPEIYYHIPNTNHTLNDYYIQDSNQGVELSLCEIVGKNKVGDKILIYSNIGRYHATFGWGNNIVNQGDSCEFELMIPVKQAGVYVLQFTIMVSHSCELVENFAGYSVAVDEETCFQAGITDFMDKDNQINVVKYLERDNIKVSILLKAKKNYIAKKGCPGLINLRNITMVLQKNYKVPQRTLVSATSDVFKELIK